MTTERPDRGARALAERLHESGLFCNDDMPELFGDGGHPEQADAILANEAVFLPDTAELERLRRIVKRAAGMGLCSQTHHEHLMIAARAALEPEGSAPEPRVVQHPVTGWTVEATAEDDVDAARMLDDLEPEGSAQG